MTSIDLTTKASVPSETSLTITVFEDVDGDGNAENSASQAIDDGTNTYTLSGFEFESGNEFWLEAEFDTDDVTKTAELDSAGLSANPVQRVSAKATTLTLLPGYNEDSQDPDGDDLNSSMPDYFGKTLDAWFLADEHTTLPDNLEDALDVTRDFAEYPGEQFRAHRIMNQIELSLETEDGRTISDWSNVSLNTNRDRDPSLVLVEGETDYGEDNAIRNIIENPNKNWFGGKDALPAKITRYDERVLRKSSNMVEVGGVEGVRTSVLHGGQDAFIVKLKEKLLELGNVRFVIEMIESGASLLTVPAWIGAPPVMYTFLELIVMADGAKLARVWDASPYPKHSLYFQETKQAESPFEPGFHWSKNEDLNVRFLEWVGKFSPLVPNVPAKYEWELDGEERVVGAGPVGEYGEDGTEIGVDNLRAELNTYFPRPFESDLPGV